MANKPLARAVGVEIPDSAGSGLADTEGEGGDEEGGRSDCAGHLRDRGADA